MRNIGSDAVVVIRAHNNEANICRIVDQVHPFQLPVFVAASGCVDDTVPRAVAHPGVRDIVITPWGLGVTTATVLMRFVNRAVVLINANTTHLPLTVVPDLVQAACAGRMGRGKFLTPSPIAAQIPVLASATNVHLPPVDPQCLDIGLQSFPRGFATSINLGAIPLNRGSDLAISLLAAEAGWMFEEVPAGPLVEEGDHGDPEHISRSVSANLEVFHRAAQRRFSHQAA